jgi:CHAT domain-containing protein/Tfp pilus assembly protein PilF
MSFSSFAKYAALSVLFLPIASIGQTLKIEYDSSRAYIQRGNFAGAIPWLEKAKTSALANPKDTNSYVEVLKLLAVSYARTSKLAEAEAVFKEVNALYDKMPSKKAVYISALQNFGVFYYNQKKYKDAEPLFAKAFELKVAVVGEDNAECLTILNSLASTRMNLKNFKEAEKDYKKLVALRSTVLGEAHPDYISALNGIANLYKVMGKFNDAAATYTKLVEVVKQAKGEGNKDYAVALTNLGNAYKALNQYEKAEPNYLLATVVYAKVLGEKNTEYGLSLVNLAGTYRYMGRYEQAEPLYFKALDLFKEATGENSAEYSGVLNNIALYYSEIGKYELAESYFKQALEVSKKALGERHPETATTINNLGLLYRSMGRYEQAEPVLVKALKIRKETIGEKTPEYAASLNNLAGIYDNTGRYDQSEPLYKQSLAIIKELYGENNPEYASTCNNLAGVYEEMNKFDKAEPLYNQALSIIKNTLGENHPDYATTLNNLALLQEAMGKKEKALEIYKQNLEATRASLGEKHPNYATSLNNYAVLLENLGRYKDAETNFLQVLNTRKEILGENHPAYATTLYDLAKLYVCLRDYAQADAYWAKALGSYLYQIDTYFPTMSDKERGKFYAKVSPKFEQFNSYCLLRYKENPAILSQMYNNQLATKALLLNSSNKVRQRILNSGDQALIEKFRNWNNQKEILSKAYSLSKGELKAQKINIEELTNTTNEFERDLSASSEIFRNSNDNQKVSWTDVQKKLKPEEAAVEMIRFVKYRFDSAGYYQPDSIHYAALFVTPGTKSNPDISVLRNGSELEKQMIKYYRNAIKFKTDDDLSYKQYWDRVKVKLQGVKTVYFSPDGVYNQLSLNTLRNSQTKGFLSDELDIKILSNTKDLLASKIGDNSEKRITLIGSPDFTYNTRNVSAAVPGISAENATYIERTSATMLTPLPGTKIEVEKISGMLSSNNWKTVIYTEQNALEEVIKKQNNPKVLHIATHGFFEGDVKTAKKKKKDKDDDDDQVVENPLLKSGLLLAGSSLTLLKRKNDQINVDIKGDNTKEDGVLTAYEAMNLNLEKTDLVVLSACETGLGEVKNGEGVYGLQRSFSIAGAKSIIISLWTVNDAATQKLMITFYQEWIKGGNKRQAFKNAQLALRKDMPEPYFWGAFVMIGE